MSDNMELGLTMMAVGMITVFSILGFVILGGKIMILLINRFFSEVQNTSVPKLVSQAIESPKMAVLIATVAAVSGGKGKITKVEKH